MEFYYDQSLYCEYVDSDMNTNWHIVQSIN